MIDILQWRIKRANSDDWIAFTNGQNVDNYFPIKSFVNI